jgi:hypothetical protein
VELIAKANHFLALLTDGSGASIKDLAKSLQIHPADISRILPLAFLSPAIVEQIFAGTQPASLTPAYLSRTRDVPASWSEQRTALLKQSLS